MPLGEFIGEMVFRGFLEVIFYTITYYTGVIVLGVVTLGQLRIAPLHTLQERNRKKTWGMDWSIWLDRPMEGRVLKADIACIVGILFWVLVVVGGCLVFAEPADEQRSEKITPPPVSEIRDVRSRSEIAPCGQDRSREGVAVLS